MFLLLCMNAAHVQLLPEEFRKIHLVPGTGLMHGCEPRRGPWEPNPRPLQNQQVIDLCCCVISQASLIYSCLLLVISYYKYIVTIFPQNRKIKSNYNRFLSLRVH